MAASSALPARLEAPPLIVALAGALSLSVAMGIGRFAFTPLLPMMLHDGSIDLVGGSLLATMNYIGYLAGALLCMALPMLLRRLRLAPASNAAMVRFGLVATVVLTAAMASALPAIWPLLRLLSGVISAIAFVYTSAWCLKRLADGNALAMSGVIYTGPGLGIALSGAVAFALTAAGTTAAAGWLSFAALGLIVTLLVWPVFRAGDRATPAVAITPTPAAGARNGWNGEQLILAIAYGIAGFGYIITATFLPVIAREVLGPSGWIELFWPVFGMAVAAGALLTRIIPMGIDRRSLLIGCYIIQAIGVVTALLMPSVAGFVIGSLLVGLPFTVISLYGMQEARRLRPVDPTGFIALMTATYGLGQIAGPPLAAAIVAGSASHQAGFATALSVASLTLLAGAALFALNKWLYPLRKS
jgi:MFS family permease